MHQLVKDLFLATHLFCNYCMYLLFGKKVMILSRVAKNIWREFFSLHMKEIIERNVPFKDAYVLFDAIILEKLIQCTFVLRYLLILSLWLWLSRCTESARGSSFSELVIE